MSHEFMNSREQILSVLDTDGGFETGAVARRISPIFGHNARTHSAFVRNELLRLESEGLVRRLDENKPVCWVKVSCIRP